MAGRVWIQDKVPAGDNSTKKVFLEPQNSSLRNSLPSSVPESTRNYVQLLIKGLNHVFHKLCLKTQCSVSLRWRWGCRAAGRRLCLTIQTGPCKSSPGLYTYSDTLTSVETVPWIGWFSPWDLIVLLHMRSDCIVRQRGTELEDNLKSVGFNWTEEFILGGPGLFRESPAIGERTVWPSWMWEQTPGFECDNSYPNQSYQENRDY